MALLTVWTIHYINQPMFFEQPWNSPEKDLGEARYLLRLSKNGTLNQRKEWLPEALSLALKQGDITLVDQILKRLDEEGLSQHAVSLVELYPRTIWTFGLTDDVWTRGNQRAGLLIRNPSSKPHKVRIGFSDGGGSGENRTAMECFIGNVRLHLNLTNLSGNESTAQIETPEMQPNEALIITFRAYHSKLHNGRDLGMRFTGAELVQ